MGSPGGVLFLQDVGEEITQQRKEIIF